MPAWISVLAGANGAGKSSIGGAFLRASGGDYFNPDELAKRLLVADQTLDQRTANSLAWQEGVDLLRSAIAAHTDFVFETTLGGDTIASLLEAAAATAGLAVRIWFVGLASPELHMARVAERVRLGGHDIPAQTIRRRFDTSRLNLIRLLPTVGEVRIFDNSETADPATGGKPKPKLVLHYSQGRILAPDEFQATPEWAKPIVAAALKLRT